MWLESISSASNLVQYKRVAIFGNIWKPKKIGEIRRVLKRGGKFGIF